MRMTKEELQNILMILSRIEWELIGLQNEVKRTNQRIDNIEKKAKDIMELLDD